MLWLILRVLGLACCRKESVLPKREGTSQRLGLTWIGQHRGTDGSMIGILSLVSLTVGVVLAGTADRHPAHMVMLERGAGTLMVAGLALLGSSLPFFP